MDLATCFVSTLIVLGLAYASLAAFRRMQQGPRREHELRFLSSLPIGQRERLILVAWRNKTLLLGVTAGAISVVDQGPACEQGAPANDAASEELNQAGFTGEFGVREAAGRARNTAHWVLDKVRRRGPDDPGSRTGSPRGLGRRP